MNLREVSDAYVVETMGRARQPQHHNRMSSIDHPCTRRLVWDRLRWAEIPPHDTATLRRFAAGRATERLLRNHLADIGVPVLKAEVALEIEGTLFGHPDGEITLDGTGRVPVEIKTLSPYLVGKIESVEQMAKVSPFYAPYPAQGQLYMTAMGHDQLLWIICPRGDHLDFRLFWQETSPEFAAMLIAKSHTIDDLVATKEMPESRWLGPVCEACHWFGDCWGGGEAASEDGEPERIADLDLAEQLARRGELEPLAKEFANLDKGVKKRLEGHKNAVCGNWHICSKRITSMRAKVPKNIAAKFMVESTYWRTSIERRKENDKCIKKS